MRAQFLCGVLLIASLGATNGWRDSCKTLARAYCSPDCIFKGLEEKAWAYPACCGGMTLSDSKRKELTLTCLDVPASCRDAIGRTCPIETYRKETKVGQTTFCTESIGETTFESLVDTCGVGRWLKKATTPCREVFLKLCPASCGIIQQRDDAINCCRNWGQQTRIDLVEKVCLVSDAPTLIQAIQNHLQKTKLTDNTITRGPGVYGDTCYMGGACYSGICLSRRCVECVVNEDCDGYKCVEGICGQCGTEFDCRPGLLCENLMCIDPRTGDPCFPGNAQVMLQDGQKVDLQALSPGDMIHVGGGNWEPLLAILKHENARAEMISISAQEKKISMTSTHLAFVLRNGALETIPAGQIRKFDLLIDAATGLSANVSMVTRAFVENTTVYSPWTASMKVDVDGFLVHTSSTDARSSAVLLHAQKLGMMLLSSAHSILPGRVFQLFSEYSVSFVVNTGLSLRNLDVSKYFTITSL